MPRRTAFEQASTPGSCRAAAAGRSTLEDTCVVSPSSGHTPDSDVHVSRQRPIPPSSRVDEVALGSSPKRSLCRITHSGHHGFSAVNREATRWVASGPTAFIGTPNTVGPSAFQVNRLSVTVAPKALLSSDRRSHRSVRCIMSSGRPSPARIHGDQRVCV